jgi:hypothetical protein
MNETKILFNIMALLRIEIEIPALLDNPTVDEQSKTLLREMARRIDASAVLPKGL